MQSNKPAQDIGQGIREAVNSAVGDVLQSVREGMVKELANAQQERDALQRQLSTSTPGGNRAALTERLAQANVKVDKLQAGIDKLDSKTDRFTTSTGQPPAFPPFPGTNDYIPEQMIISIIGIIFIGFPLALTFARIIWKRTSHTPPSASQLPAAESTRRFDQLEQSVDAIAIEVERISENQRYLTKLLSEPKQAAVGSGRGGLPPTS